MNTKTPLAFCAFTLSIAALAYLTLPSRAAELGTRQRTICPVPLEAPVLITASNVAAYAETGYSTWEWGAGVDGASPDRQAGGGLAHGWPGRRRWK